MKQKFKNYLNIIYPILSLLLFFVIWIILARIVDLEVILPSPKVSIQSLGEIIITKEYWISIIETLKRTLISFLLSMSTAIIFAVLSSLIKPIYKLLSPIVIIFRAIPTMAVILLSLIWFKSQITPLFIAFLIIFPILYSNFYSSFSNIDKDIIEMSKIYNVGKKNMIFKMYLPAVAPSIFDSIRSSISLNVKLIIAAEVLAQTRNSIGVMMHISQVYLDTAMLVAWTITAIILSYLLELIVALIKRLVVRW